MHAKAGNSREYYMNKRMRFGFCPLIKWKGDKERPPRFN